MSVAAAAAAKIQRRYREWRTRRLMKRHRRRLVAGSDDDDDDDSSSEDDDDAVDDERRRLHRASSSSAAAAPPSEARRRAKLVKCALLAIAWFTLSTGLAVFNKALFGQRKGGFPAPLLLTACQFAMQYALASAIVHRAFGGALRPKREVPAEVYWRRVAPVGAAMGMDIALSNLSLVFVTVSFYTLVKTSSIIFLLLFAFALKLEPVSFRLMGVAALLTGGQALTVDGETRFDARGCALVVAAAACSGLRWTLSQIVLQGKEPGGGAGGAGDNKNTNGRDGSRRDPRRLRKSYGLSHPVVMLKTMTPLMCGVVLAFSLLTERPWDALPGSAWLSGPGDFVVDLMIVTCGACAALAMTVAEFELLKETSAVTVMVIGVAKDVVQVLTAIAVYGDAFGVENGMGMALVLGGIVAYNRHKALAAEERAAALGTMAGAGAGAGAGEGVARGPGLGLGGSAEREIGLPRVVPRRSGGLSAVPNLPRRDAAS